MGVWAAGAWEQSCSLRRPVRQAPWVTLCSALSSLCSWSEGAGGAPRASRALKLSFLPIKNQKVVNAELEGKRWATTFHVPVFGAEQDSRGQAESSFCQCVVAQTLGVK